MSDIKEPDISLGMITGGKIRTEKEIDEILNRIVTKYGNSCHIPVPSKHKDKEAQVIIWRKDKILSSGEMLQKVITEAEKKEEEEKKK